ncbi:hypothetical protein [Cupriavidus taiwanensis]|nr:hypothetical protein [Cupriavidus taiwanensis]
MIGAAVGTLIAFASGNPAFVFVDLLGLGLGTKLGLSIVKGAKADAQSHRDLSRATDDLAALAMDGAKVVVAGATVAGRKLGRGLVTVGKWGLFTVIVVLMFVERGVIKDVMTHRDPPPAVRPTSYSSPAPTPVSPDTSASIDSYNAAVSRLERQYPKIDPNSPLYQATATKQIRARRDELMVLGMPRIVALEQAVKEAFGAPTVNNAPATVRPSVVKKETAADRAERQRKIYEAVDGLGTYHGY